MRVLVAEDHHILARTIATGLRRQAMAVDVAASGDEAERMCLLTDYDVLILDRDLPVMTGDEVCRRLRELTGPPRILMLTAAGETTDKVYGLTALGADDYLAKPFDFAELVARVRALSRRAPTSPPVVLRHEGITLDRARREVSTDGRPLELTPKEFAVLQLLRHCDGSANACRSRHALVRHRGEQYTASARRSTPAADGVPHTGQTATRSGPSRITATRAFVRRTIRQCLARHAAEQYTAPGRALGFNRPPHSGHRRPRGRPLRLATPPR